MGEHGTLSCMYGGTWLGNDFFFFKLYTNRNNDVMFGKYNAPL